MKLICTYTVCCKDGGQEEDQASHRVRYRVFLAGLECPVEESRTTNCEIQGVPCRTRVSCGGVSYHKLRDTGCSLQD